MKLLQSVFFILASCICIAQKPKTEMQVTYQEYHDTSWPFTIPAVLHICDSATIYQIKPDMRKDWTGGKAKDDVIPYAPSMRKVPDDYIKMNHQTKEILSFEVLPTVGVFVKDNFPVLNWDIIAETKLTTDFGLCQKAETTYRGRKWIAWFTPSIAVPYGPWKLHGLPGLIVEAYSSDEKYTMKAFKVEYIGSDLFTQKFSNLKKAQRKACNLQAVPR